MTTKFVQRCISALTFVMIMMLLAVIVFVWIQFIPNTYKSKQFLRGNVSTLEQHTIITGTTPSRKKIDYINEPANIVMVEKVTDANIELVKPMKTNPSPPEQMELDTVYDKLDHNGKPTLRHRNAHFRHKTADVWDQHPSYEIEAFGRRMVLELENNNKFVPPDLHITTHLHENYTKRVRHDPRMASCFYTGKIRDDPGSAVAVSLCNGMTGYIRTSDENYFISPEKGWNSSTENFIHRMERVSHASKEYNDVISSESDCDTNDSQSIIEDDVPSESAERHYKHVINKRDILFDTIDDPVDSKENSQVFRTTRNTDYMENYEKNSHEYFIKLLIVADKTMVQYHKTDDGLKHYILTLMSHVSLLFKDASIGNAMSIAVVDIAILHHGDFSHSNSQGTLKKFCDWKQMYTTEDMHDAALLLTRDTICKNSTANMCTTLGLAEVGSMCSHLGGCAIVKDNGLSASYTIAHELGHLLGMPHDDNKMCRRFKNGTKFNNIMSKMMRNEAGRWMWSMCSKYFLNEFLQSKRAKCLSRFPSKSHIIASNLMLPGEIFEVNKQCELEFGPGSTICPYMDPQCDSLWCTEGTGCKTNHLPWAEGTPCNNNGWCHHGKCIDVARDQFAPVDGGWGTWQPWSQCSRTCGGGIRHSRRQCDSPTPENGGAYCNGPSVRYESCNIDDCDINAPEFRAIQCAEFDGNSSNLPNITNNVHWVPQYGSDRAEDLCRLYCRPMDSKTSYMLADKVRDGTKCGLNNFDICVNGICMPGGCDNRLESTMVLDDCGICGGDNRKCKEISGTYNISMFGYNRVVRIPKGSSNLDIRQRAFNGSALDANYLALVDGETGQYILNGNHMANTNEEDVVFGSLIIKYSGANASVERITTPKNHKLTKDLVVEVLCVGNITPPDINYRYVISQENAPKYSWNLYEKQWSKCNSICSGTQHMRPVCVELASDKHVADEFCEHLRIHNEMQKRECNTHCQLTWNIKMKGACSGTHCGKGFRTVYYNCMQVDTKNAGYSKLVDEKHCDILPKPPNMEACETVCDTLRWEFSKWSKCSQTCGGGVQYRTAHCVNNNTRIDDSHCNNDEKVTKQICNTNRCPIWMVYPSSPCSVSCGGGYKNMTSYCLIGGRIDSDMACDQNERPPDREPCNQQPCVEWTPEPWTECSVTCGIGVEIQRFKCRRKDNNRIVNDLHCRKIEKPDDVTKVCEKKSCNEFEDKSRYRYDMTNSINDYEQTLTFKWVAGDWSPCSKSCNGGTKYQLYYCKNNLGAEDERMCNYNLKPKNEMQCNINSCPNWKYGDWSPNCDQNCERHRQVRCMDDFSGVIEDSKCNVTDKPSTSRKCPLYECPNDVPRTYFTSKENHEKRYVWKVGKWKQCSNSCGKGTRRRHINCEDTLNDIIVVDSLCNHLPKPKIIKPCERFNCKFAWIDDHWSSCSASCGPGIKTRNVNCHRVHRGGYIDPVPLPNIYTERIHHKNYCSMHKKPNSTMKCLISHCTDEYVWQPGEWKQCSHTCGRRARQIRPVYCVNVKTKQKVQRYYCPKELRPPRKRKCNNFKCLPKSCDEVRHYKHTKRDDEYFIAVNNRPVRIYCHKMNTNAPEEFISLQSTSSNYAEFYDKRLIKSDTCEDHHIDNWVEVGSDRSGLTNFRKVRLNITSLQIIGDDYTFATQLRGVKIPYGTAGDCYSSLTNCVQGRFSIDLSSTSFRLSDDVNWQHIGNNASSHVRKMETRTTGKCGGFCGKCYPDPSIGLHVEVTHT